MRNQLLSFRPWAMLLALGVVMRLALPGHSDEPKAAKAATPGAAVKVAAPVDGQIPDSWAKALQWRCIGPANMGGRITAISVFDADPTTYWVATASGGLLKTTNNGVTFKHQFDKEATVSIGDVSVAPSNKNIVWVGTGENNPRNSVSYGDGVYKSTDGGDTWKNMGLNKIYQTGKIIVHPKNPDVVYVGALGRLYGNNEERGVFKTSDGGQTWTKVLFIDSKTGIIDMRMSPADPETLIVATWERRRDEFDGFFGNPPVPDMYGPIVTHAPGSGLHKTSDGGKSWKKLTQGLPTVKMGRIGLDWSRKNPNVVFAIIDSEKAGTGSPPVLVYMGFFGEANKPGAKLTSITKDSPAEKAGLKAGDVVTKVDGKVVGDFDDLVDMARERKVGDKLKFEVQRANEKKEMELVLGPRPAEEGRGGAGAGGGAGGRAMLTPGFVGEDTPEGVKVTRVTEDGAAAKAGIKADDVVTQADGKPIGEFRVFMFQALQDRKVGDKVKFTVQRGKEKLEVTVALEEGRFGGGFGGGAGGGGGARGGASAAKPYASQLGGQAANVQDQQGRTGFETGGIYRSDDAGESWKRINSINPRPMYFSQIRVDPSDENWLYVAGVNFAYSDDGGRRFRSGKDRGVHSDHHALWIDPRDGRHMILGTDGGFYVTYDRGENWDHHNFHAIGQFYHVACDNRPNYKVYGGLQDNGSWGGPAFSSRGGITNEDWIYISGGDGFVCRVDPNDPDLIYAESQGGAMNRRNLRTGERGSISPNRGGFGGGAGGGGGRPGGARPDPMQPMPNPMQPMGEAPAPGAGPQRHRFNWNTPYILSHHNSSIFYCAGEVVFRSVKKGDELKVISPEITRSKAGSATALSESPRNADVIWAGTDDGFVWVTRDGGVKWTNVTESIRKAGLPGYRWVATIEASRTEAGRAYVCFDAHRSDDDNPYVFVTEDYGATWKPIHSNLPWGSTRCLREDIKNDKVLYLGTEFGAWASVNRGASWTKISNNLPTVAIHEFAQHPTSGELIAATHGRSIWVTDISAIRQMTAETVKAKAQLYAPATAIRWRVEQNRGMFSGAERKFVTRNAEPGAQIYYSLTQEAKKVELSVMDYAGKVVRTLTTKMEPGLHRVTWDLSRSTGGGAGGGGRPGGGGGGAGGGGRFGGFARGASVAPGTYRLVLNVDGQEFVQPVVVAADPTQPAGSATVEQEEEMDETDK